MPIEVCICSNTTDTWWRALLRESARLIDRYCEPSCEPSKDEHENDEAPYWHGERATLGLLCAAAWRTPGGWSLMEYSARRRSSGQRVPPKGDAGKGDAWIGYYRSRNRQRNWNVECKTCWVSLDKDQEEIIHGLTAKLNTAKKDLTNLTRKYQLDEGLAVCFLVPSHRRDSKTRSSVAVKKMKDLFGTLKKQSAGRYALLALYRPPRGTVLIDYRSRYSPGLIFLAERVPFRSGEAHKEKHP